MPISKAYLNPDPCTVYRSDLFSFYGVWRKIGFRISTRQVHLENINNPYTHNHTHTKHTHINTHPLYYSRRKKWERMVNKRLSLLTTYMHIRMHLTLFIIYCTATLSSHSFYTFPFSCILLVHCIHIAQPGLMVADCENMQDIIFPNTGLTFLWNYFSFPTSLLEVKLPYEPVCPSVGRLVCLSSFPKVSLPCSYWSTCSYTYVQCKYIFCTHSISFYLWLHSKAAKYYKNMIYIYIINIFKSLISRFQHN